MGERVVERVERSLQDVPQIEKIILHLQNLTEMNYPRKDRWVHVETK